MPRSNDNKATYRSPPPADGSDTEGSDADTGDACNYDVFTPLHLQRMSHKFERTNAFHSRVRGSYHYPKSSDEGSSSSQEDNVRRAYEAYYSRDRFANKSRLRRFDNDDASPRGRSGRVYPKHAWDSGAARFGPRGTYGPRIEVPRDDSAYETSNSEENDADKHTPSKRQRGEASLDDEAPRPRRNNGKKVTFKLDSDYEDHSDGEPRRKPRRHSDMAQWAQPAPEQDIAAMYSNLPRAEQDKILAIIKKNEGIAVTKDNLDEEDGHGAGPGPATKAARQRAAIMAACEELRRIEQEEDGSADVKKCGKAIDQLEDKLAEMSAQSTNGEDLQSVLKWFQPLMDKLDGKDMAAQVKTWRKSEGGVQGKIEAAIANAQSNAKELMGKVDTEFSKLQVALQAKHAMVAETREDMNEILVPRREEMNEVLAERDEHEAELRKKAASLPDSDKLDMLIRQAALKCAQR